MNSSENKTKRKPNPRENAFPLSIATLWYTIPTFIRGYKGNLDLTDLTETWSEHKSNTLGNKTETFWKSEEERAVKAKTKPSLLRVLIKVFWWDFAFYGSLLSISEVIKLCQPVFIGLLISYYKPGQTEVTHEQALWYAGGIVISTLGNVIFVHPYVLGMQHLGMKLRVACCSLIYRKSLKLSKTALGQTTVGQVVNLLANDVNRFDVAMIFVHYMWIGPLETIISTYFIYLQVGISAVFGVLVLILFIPLQIYLGKKVSTFRLRTALRTDERVRLMNEIISGIQVIKMYAWEKPFVHLLKLTRRSEIASVEMMSYLRGLTLTFIMYNTRISIFISILVYVLTGHDITAEKVFVIASFYNILRVTMTVFFPQGITYLAEAMVSVDRLNKYMLYEENQISKKIRQEEFNEKSNLEKGNGVFHKKEPGIFIKNGTAKWNEFSSDNTISDLNLSVTNGKLLAVIGPVGSGKTSLLNVVLQELPLSGGSLEVNGKISYASQETWLFAGSVRQNILFGLPMDKMRYKTVVKKCALERDFQLLPYGDKTIVGDRGVSLSGGQRARINLARAVYKDADIYLLDDPLSAVDTHVGKQLFEKCISGFLKNKTVILVTHQLQYLKEVGHILYLDDGVSKAQGSFEELQATGLDFTELLGSNIEEDEDKTLDKPNLQRQESIKSVASIEIDAPIEVEEQKSTGTIGSSIYKAYFAAGGNCCVISAVFFLFFVAQVFASAADSFITHWVNLEQKNQSTANSSRYETNSTTIFLTNSTSSSESNATNTDFWNFSRETCVYVYSGIILFLILSTIFRSYVFFKVCMRASIKLHDNMFSSIIRTTMRFFNTNSSGRILNRFSKDIGAVDELLPASIVDCLQIGFQFIGIIIVVAYINHWLLIPTFFVGVIFYLLRNFYLKTSRNVKRLESVTRSPVFSHLNASLQGLTTIRAFGAQDILKVEFDNHQDLHSSAWFSFIATSRAFGYWLDIVCVIYIILVTFSFLMLGSEKYGGNVGLAITQAIGLTGMLQWGMRQSTEMENQMTSVERVLEYSRLESEPSLESKPEKKPKSSWPDLGKVTFKNVYLHYFLNDPPVLKDLSFVIQPKEKVGIVGRTGAGKSSLINAIFQLTNTSGEIIIDDVNIAEIGLHDLRSRISIIPQEPVLFSGTMRLNLDPFDEYNDADIWKVLEEVELKEVVQDLQSGLNSIMSEGGTNFSVGQRQLVCLARAILRNNKVLVLDEATANVDPQTDALIQNTIRRKFAYCTVLTIAHRLNTVMDSDKVLVMDAGTLKEFDHPFTLMQNKDGVFYGMVQKTGKSMADTLYKVAQENFKKIKSD